MELNCGGHDLLPYLTATLVTKALESVFANSAMTLEEISAMSREELTERFDSFAGGFDELAGYKKMLPSIIQDELHHRDQQAVSDQMWWMTFIVTLLTATNVVLVAYQVISSC